MVKNLLKLSGSGRSLDALPDMLAPHINVIAGEDQNPVGFFPVRKAQPPPAPVSPWLYLECEARLLHPEL